MRSEEAALLERIREEPYDDEPRLVLADALQARGDPRGELIAIQCALAPLLDRFSAQHPDVSPLIDRERVLLDGVELQSPGLKRLGVQAKFRRGFPHAPG